MPRMMTKRYCAAAIAAGILALAVRPLCGQEVPGIESYTEGLPFERGLLPTFFDPVTGRLLLEVPHGGEPVLHGLMLSTGLDWPLDRGFTPWDSAANAPRPPEALRFRLLNAEVVILRGDQKSTPIEESPDTVSTLPLVARTGDRLLVDATDLLVRDAFGVAQSLEWVGESGTLDHRHSRVVWPAPEGTDRSTSIDVRLVFAAPGGSQWLERRSPDPGRLTIVQRHIFFRGSPEFRPRPADDRLGLETSSNGPVLRWQLPRPPASPRELTVYLEATIPIEHRAAVRDGIAYWQRILSAVGHSDTIRAADLPADADPLDLRYPVVIVWLEHGQPLASMTHHLFDPDTGELVKAVVQLDSRTPLFARNEHRAYRAALAEGSASESDYVGARIAFVTAHELAHVFGLRHAGYRETAVGFHPARLRPDGERVAMDLDRIVPEEPRPYDLWLARYAYAPLEPGDEKPELAEIAAAGQRRGLRYLDPAIRPLMPQAVGRIWNPDILDGLLEAMAVRATLLARFGEQALDPGEPKDHLYERLVPVYFHHRFPLEAACRMVGGLEGIGAAEDLVPVTAAEQWRALDSILDALTPRHLKVPPGLETLMPPGPDPSTDLRLLGEVEEPNLFRFQTGTYAPTDIVVVPGASFDPIPWSESLASTVLSFLLDRQRAAQLQAQAAEDSSLPSLTEVIDVLVARTLLADPVSMQPEESYDLAVRRLLLARLIALASDQQAAPTARDAVRAHLVELRRRLDPEADMSPQHRAFLLAALDDLDEFLRKPDAVR